MKEQLQNKAEEGTMKASSPLVIAGPCSAETEAQVLEAAHLLKGGRVSLFRAGIWKPRTRPGHFEGVGEVGLHWLKRVKEETGLPTAVEVATTQHVELALKHGVDVLWIGARTTVNPFMIQELAASLRGVDKQVLIKNPVNPDLSLWVGAVERFEKEGVKDLGLIHRGFSSYEKSRFRNDPQWQIPIDMRVRFPQLPMILDPSHIAGNRDYLLALCQKALDLNYSGLMIESHPSPADAWSDADQQVTPSSLFSLLDALQPKVEYSDQEGFQQALSQLRTIIEVYDEQLMDVLGRRMSCAEKIGALKKEQHVTILQQNRWQAVVDKMMLLGQQNGLSEGFVLKLLESIHQESIERQRL